jgi:hypothetical protein
MGRKQALQRKKERARLEELEGRLERLSRQGSDESVLELARGRTRDLSPAALELCGRVADRALRRALAGADLPRVRRLLSGIDRDLRSRPLAGLADSVLHLAEGRLDEARDRLAAVASEEEAGDAPWSRGLTEALAALGSGAAVESPEAQAVERFGRALAGFQDRGFRPPPEEVETLRRAAEELRSALPDPAVRRLVEAALERLRLLAELAGLAEALAHRKGAAFLPFFLERVRGLSRALLAALCDGPPAALLRPLHHSLRLRWRDLLALVAERQGATAWEEVHAAWPALAAVDLEVAGGPGEARNRAAVRELRKAGDHRQLAQLLGSLSGAEKAPGRRTLLWSLELWAWEQAEGGGEDQEGWLPMLAETPWHAALVRVGKMASDLDRLPSEQRPEVARFLRARLFDLLERQPFCGHALEAADALLRQLPGDPGLLLVALTAAACKADVRAQGLFASRIAERGQARAADRETVLRVVSQVVLESVEVLVRVLPSLRLLLGEEAWPEALEIVIESIIELVCGLVGAPPEEVDFRRLAQDLEICRPALDDRTELEALLAAVACVRPGGDGERALRDLLDRTQQLEPALAALRVLRAASFPWASAAVGKAIEPARDAVISRLDLRWQLWIPVLPALTVGASRTQVRRLRDRIRGLLRTKGLQEEDRQALEGSLKRIAELQRIASAIRSGSKREEGRRRSKPRRRRDPEQLGFDLF